MNEQLLTDLNCFFLSFSDLFFPHEIWQQTLLKRIIVIIVIYWIGIKVRSVFLS